MYPIRMDEFSRIQSSSTPEKFFEKNWMSFQVIGLAPNQKMEISNKKWMTYPGIGLSHHQEN